MLLIRGQQGAILMETTMALAIFAIVGIAVLSGFATAQISKRDVAYQFIVESLARNQMEDALNQPYQGPPFTYPPISAPEGYTVTAEAVEYEVSDQNIEKITVTVNRSGQAYVLETLRTR